MGRRTGTPSEDDRVAAARLVLDGLADREPLDSIWRRLRPFVEYRFPFPGDVLTEIAASALDVAGARRTAPLAPRSQAGLERRTTARVAPRTTGFHNHSRASNLCGMDESVNVALEEFGISRDRITEFIRDTLAKRGDVLS